MVSSVMSTMMARHAVGRPSSGRRGAVALAPRLLYLLPSLSSLNTFVDPFGLIVNRIL